jgi:hypothetical protein
MRKTVLLFLIAASFRPPISADGFKLFPEVLSINDEKIIFYVRFADEKRGIINEFYGLLNGKEKVVWFKDRVIYDRNNEPIIDLSKHTIPLFGFKLHMSYPKSTKFAPGLYLDPYFNGGTSVGDSLRIEWNTATKTFYKRISQIP